MEQREFRGDDPLYPSGEIPPGTDHSYANIFHHSGCCGRQLRTGFLHGLTHRCVNGERFMLRGKHTSPRHQHTRSDGPRIHLRSRKTRQRHLAMPHDRRQKNGGLHRTVRRRIKPEKGDFGGHHRRKFLCGHHSEEENHLLRKRSIQMQGDPHPPEHIVRGRHLPACFEHGGPGGKMFRPKGFQGCGLLRTFLSERIRGHGQQKQIRDLRKISENFPLLPSINAKRRASIPEYPPYLFSRQALDQLLVTAPPSSDCSRNHRRRS